MSPFRYRDDDSSTGTTLATVLIGAVAGFAVGMYVAQRVGGYDGLANRLRRRKGSDTESLRYEGTGQYDEIEDEIEDDVSEARFSSSLDEDADFNGMDATDEDESAPLLEERVLEAFNNDPILSERAIDIGSVGRGIIELAGWVDDDSEANHAMTLARGVPGVETVVNRLMIDDEERQIGSNVRRFEDGDPAMKGARWEGQQVGTGRRRQGSSDEADRHADPKPVLEDRWLSEREALRNSADDVGEVTASRRAARSRSERATKGDQIEPPPEA
jgi:hypothetical protein